MRVTRRRAGTDRPSARAPVLLRSQPVSPPDACGTGGGPDRAAAPFLTGGAVGHEGGGGGTRWASGTVAYTAPTDCRVLILPRARLLQHLYRTRLPALTVAPSTAPESRLLLAHLDAAWSLAEQLGPDATHATGEAMAMLLTGLIRTHAPTAIPPQSLRAAATAYADSRLRDPDLAPATIARALNVSVRTLHRAFADGQTVMAYVRRRRLEGARRELDCPGSPYTVADVAARWQFADSSHFRRAHRGT